ncbi:hypothetical protein Cgig2_012808 [Carnegiea gigantea]|uniref:Uncharacterized protein n=1 Tax=Carnegiea gigantea TaxID=171969 RepID=A0A9Q1KCK8_9CARY|nr:hypothetical protein Cgig2_012808 [Carnegiea gigantea]
MASMLGIAILSHLILAFCIASSAISFAGVNGDGAIGISKQREFDYFVLSLQWPGTYCRGTKWCCRKNGCCRGENAPLQFTIHCNCSSDGLWPQYNYRGWPSCCTNSQFDMKQISTLRDDLEKYWPSLSCGSPSTCDGHKGTFWGHEIPGPGAMRLPNQRCNRTHGTCALSVLQNEYDYFRTALIIYFKYNVTEVLREAGYVASNSEKYPLRGIISAIQNAFHTTPLIICSHGAVEELHLCFYKDFKPRDCVTNNEVDASNKSCPKYVSLPIYSSLGGSKPSILNNLGCSHHW